VDHGKRTDVITFVFDHAFGGRLCLFGQFHSVLLQSGVDALPQADFPEGVSAT
jgi:hypothetical protein